MDVVFHASRLKESDGDDASTGDGRRYTVHLGQWCPAFFEPTYIKYLVNIFLSYYTFHFLFIFIEQNYVYVFFLTRIAVNFIFEDKK